MTQPNLVPDRHRYLTLAGLSLLGLAALASLATGVRHAMQYGSHDLQWMGGRLLAAHIDPWGERLANYPHRLTHFSPPNYLHLLYLLFIPFASLSFQTAEILWCGLSIGFSIAAIYLLTRLFALSRSQGLLVLFLLWMSSPFRVVLEVGQMSLFELFFLSLAFSASTAWLAGAAFGISLVKYSFSPVAGVLFLLRRRYLLLVVAIAICSLAVLGVHLFVPTPLLQLAREPFEVSRLAVSPGLADIMTFSEYSLRPHLGFEHAKSISYALGIAGSVAYAFLISRYRTSRAVELTMVGVGSLLFFKHLVYDYVFLAIPLCYAISLRRVHSKVPIIAGVLIFWFLAAFLNRAANDLEVHLGALAFNFLLLASLLGYTTWIALRPESEDRMADTTERVACLKV